MNWNPSLDFRLDLGYVNHGDFQGNPLTLQHCDLTHLGMWSKGILTEQGVVHKEADEKGAEFDKALAAAAFLTWAIGPAFDAIAKRFRSGLEKPVQTAIDNLHHATELYRKQHGDDVKAILKAEQEDRWRTGAILNGDITKENVDAVRKIHPHANYKGRVEWILKNLEPVKDGFSEDYAYWQGVLKLLGG